LFCFYFFFFLFFFFPSQATGHHELAEHGLTVALKALRRCHPPQPARVLTFLQMLSDCYCRQDRFDDGLEGKKKLWIITASHPPFAFVRPAAEVCLREVAHTREYETDRAVGRALVRLGEVYAQAGRNDLALEAFQQHLVLALELRDAEHWQVEAFLRLATFLDTRKRNSSAAVLLLQQCVTHARQMQNQMHAHFHLGEILFRLGSVVPAISNLQTALRMANTQNHRDLQLRSLLLLGQMYEPTTKKNKNKKQKLG
jgi:tetratricopeptide (TPR) repeat protein